MPKPLIPEDIWETAKKNKTIEHYDEKTVFDFTQKEADRCRFEIVNQNYRLAECTVHKKEFSHGYRLHPPHLWNIIEGKLYKRAEGKWERFVPNHRINLKNMEVSRRDSQ